MKEGENEMACKVTLLQHTSNPEETCALAARLCYSSASIEDLKEKMTPEKCKELIEKIVSVGHYSVLEHASFTFGVEGVSRTLSHQLVRHRIASFSQQSQRYVEFKSGIPSSIPPSIKANPEALCVFDEAMAVAEKAYANLVSLGIPAEDARFVAPGAAETKLVFTMNARELLHFLGHRTCNRAQWEIRAMADQVLALLVEVAPIIFSNCGPGCATVGKCSEGKMCCGKPRTMVEILASAL